MYALSLSSSFTSLSYHTARTQRTRELKLLAILVFIVTVKPNARAQSSKRVSFVPLQLELFSPTRQSYANASTDDGNDDQPRATEQQKQHSYLTLQEREQKTPGAEVTPKRRLAKRTKRVGGGGGGVASPAAKPKANIPDLSEGQGIADTPTRLNKKTTATKTTSSLASSSSRPTHSKAHYYDSDGLENQKNE